MKFWRLAAAISFIAFLYSGTARAFSESDAMAALVAAYPDALLKYEGRALHWRDGTITEIFPGEEVKPFGQALRGASLLDRKSVV